MREGDALPTIEKQVTQTGIEKYASASGDFNPIHVNRELAAASQFGSTIAHGMMVAASISEAMAATFKLDWLEGGRLKLRFRSPVFPGDTVTTSGQVKSIRKRNDASEVTCSVEVRRQNGGVAITGDATVLVRRA